MNARRLMTAAVALGIFASSGAALRAQSITFSFGDRDRESMREWYRANSDAPEFRRRRWDRRFDERLRVGMVLGPDLQGWARPAPPGLYRRLAPLPRGLRYMIVGDNLVVVDRRWRIRDVNRFDRFEGGYSNDRPGRMGPGRTDRNDWNDRNYRNDRFEGRVVVGEVLAPHLRDNTGPVPPEVQYRLPRRPDYLRYVVLGDRILLLDRAWIVRESIPLELTR